MIIYVDIDETICNTNGLDYNKSTPIHENILKINMLFEKGHIIAYWTARGSKTGIDWSELTKKQLQDWNCKYTFIETLKKPVFDVFIDDKAINSKLHWDEKTIQETYLKTNK